MKTLVVDDNPTNRKYLRVLLTGSGHSVLEAGDGIEALQLLDREPVDAVISDILMPRMDGYRLCYEIRKKPALNAVRFVAYSAAYTSDRDEKLALDFGADAFVRKPAAPEAIIEALHDAAKAPVRTDPPLGRADELSVIREYSEALVRRLEETNTELLEANESLRNRAALAEFSADVTGAFSRKEGAREVLQLCAEAMVRRLGAALARIWTYNQERKVLELQASAGLYTHIDGGHSRVPLGQFKIGLIASERQPHLTNAVIADPRVHDQDWAKREGMVAFAGYPLLVGERLLGVMAMFSRKPIEPSALAVMAAVAQAIALGIERKTTEEELLQSEERFRELAETIREVFFIAGPDGTPVYYVSPAFEQITGYSRKGFETNPRFWLELLHPDDRARAERAYREAPDKFLDEHRIVRPDGSIRWLRARAFPVRDEAGNIIRLVGIAEDVTKRKRAEQEAQANLEQIQALREIDRAITSTLDLRAQLDLLLEKIGAFVPLVAASTVRLFDRDTGKLESLACRGIDENRWRSGWSGRAETVAQSRAPETIRNIYEDSRTSNPVFAEAGLISYLGVPFFVQDKVLGVLGLYTATEHEFSEREIEFVTTLADQAAVAIQNATLYQEARKQQLAVTEQERIQRVLKELSQDIARMDLAKLMEKLCATIRAVFKSDTADVRFIDGDRWSKIVFASDGLVEHLPQGGEPIVGATAWVVKNRKSIAIRDYRDRKEFMPGRITNLYGFRGFFAAPLLSRSGEVIGVIRARYKQPRTFTAREIDLFEQLANGAAIAIENERLYEDLEKSNKSKSEFLSMMSHELRTPLNVILGYAALAKADAGGASGAGLYSAMDKVETHSRHLLNRIDTIIKAAQIESGTVVVTKAPIDLGALFERLKAAHNPPPEKNIQLVWRLPDRLPPLVTDSEKLQQIAIQLIDNAIKFTESGTVVVSARMANREQRRPGNEELEEDLGVDPPRAIELTVSDTGIGIAHDHLSLLFELFSQGDSSAARSHEGMGLGLYIAKRYADLLGGTLTVQSTEGRGSTFTMRLPAEEAALHQSQHIAVVPAN